ncbi:hypothetical protein E3N88_46228 [Mikania micrantha]|uniref:Uncharacterized protein n=1 Tax=Mikania micrantha TaxID=192012 RepID=A0A5N6L6X4_9ASTR|nr:hypothetical protein E3N88_46228 [Mikania micrantha]
MVAPAFVTGYGLITIEFCAAQACLTSGQPLTVKFLRRMIDVMMSCDADCQPRMNGCHELNVMYELRRKCKVRKIVSVMHVEEMGWETFRTYELGKWLITPDQRH